MSPHTNELLAHIPDEEFMSMTRNMKLVSLVKGQTLFEAGQIPSEVHYPVGAVASMMIELSDGFSVEAHMFGKACMVGVGTIGVPSFYSAKVRSSGLAYSLPVENLRQAWQTCPGYASASQRAMQRVFRQLSQSVICGKRHSVDQQLIRWILISLDRTLTEIIPITHQELSELLGFRREAVTLALGKLCETGLISCGRGQLTVMDRQKLETLACDCYWIGQEKPRP
jgi:CRP-like cAMP-binding protein